MVLLFSAAELRGVSNGLRQSSHEARGNRDEARERAREPPQLAVMIYLVIGGGWYAGNPCCGG